jgi:hypothetical protein
MLPPRLVARLLLAAILHAVLAGLLPFGFALLQPARLVAFLIGLVIFLVHDPAPSSQRIATGRQRGDGVFVSPVQPEVARQVYMRAR